MNGHNERIAAEAQYFSAIEPYVQENQTLRAEIERLRGIIRTNANNLDTVGAHYYASWARRALEVH